MTMLTIEISDGLLLKAFSAAAAKQISFEDYLEELLLEADAEEKVEKSEGFAFNLETAIAEALARATALPADKLFQLQDLFSDEEWARIASPRWFGRKFRPAVESAAIAMFKEKTQTNKAIYRRN